MNLIYGDSLEMLRRMPNKSVDVCITDPPYGITKDKWDVVPPAALFNEIFRVSKHQVIFGGHFFDLPKKDGWLVWNKMPFLKTTNQCEFIWTSLLKKNKIIDFRYAGNVVGNTKRPDYKREKVFFTSEKPVEFVKELISFLRLANSSVIDPFMGTGNICKAAKEMACDVIGIEREHKHFEIAKQRLSA